MTAAHTSGPWIASWNRVYMGAAMERREVAVATKADPVIRHAAEANARLISLAPEMLEALETILSVWDEHRIIGATMYHDARALIARARVSGRAR